MKSKKDARLKIVAHITDFLMEFTPIEGLDAVQIVELEEEAREQAVLLIDSMGLEVESFGDGAIAVTLRLANVPEFIDDYLDKHFVEDVNL